MDVGNEGSDKAMSGGDSVDMSAMDVCQVICYDVGYEVVTPMTQIAEILPSHDDLHIFGSGKTSERHRCQSPQGDPDL